MGATLVASFALAVSLCAIRTVVADIGTAPASHDPAAAPNIDPLIVDTKPAASGVFTDIDERSKVIEIDLMLKNEKGETPVVGTARISL